MNLQFSSKELAAIFYLASKMVMADGKVDEREKASLALELVRLGVEKNQLDRLAADAEAMEPSEAISIVSRLGNDGKKYVTAFLGALMAVDGNIDDTEIKLWNLISALCDLPTMNVMQALETMKNL